jgi:hypothetical protein
MGALLGLSINVEDLPKEKFVKGKKGTYYNFTISINDKTNDFGQNVSAFDSQTKEEREAKAPKKYLGNGKVFWTDGTIVKAELKEEANQSSIDSNTIDDLPF